MTDLRFRPASISVAVNRPTTPRRVVEPKGKRDRDRWRQARDRALQAVPDLSSLDF